MSIFKVKPWWSNENLLTEKYEEGLQNANSIKVDRFNIYSESDCIIIGYESIIKIYKPNIEDSSHIILESQLNDIILQIGTGKFTTDAQDRQIIVLHPTSFVVYCLERKEGHIDLGDQNAIKAILKHSFNRKSSGLICGPFGSSKTRDFICVQALDGTLSFFDQDTFLFMCLYEDVIIPGPICYVPSSDLFLICKPTWILETYSYQQLGEFRELNVKTSKKNIPQWTYNPGEEITSLNVIRTSSNFSSIIALGERHMYCFQDNGLMKFMIRFDYIPICFHSYLIGWYYEPTSRLLIMVASDDSKLYIYEGSTLLWSCDILQKAISISRCYLKSLSGGLVTLTKNGVLNISYLGTEPDLNSNSTPMNDYLDPEQVQTELERVEESLQKIIATKEDTSDNFARIDKILQIKADIGKPPSSDYRNANAEELLIMSSIVVILTCAEPGAIRTVQITYDCHPPMVCTETAISLDNINGTEIIETGLYVCGEADVCNASVDIIFTIIDSTEKISVRSKKLMLPLNMYCAPVSSTPEIKAMLSIKCNAHPNVDFSDIFTDFSKEEIESKTNLNGITFAYRCSNKTVTVKSSANEYTFGAEDFSEIYPMLIYFTHNLTNHYSRIGKANCVANVEINSDLNRLILHRFLKCVDNHAKQRITMKKLEFYWQPQDPIKRQVYAQRVTLFNKLVSKPTLKDNVLKYIPNDLNVLQKQFTLVQKRLLVQYGSVPPADCDSLEFLMRDTHQRIVNVARELLLKKQQVCCAGNTMSATGHLLMHVIKQMTPDDWKVKLIEQMLCLDTLSEQFQEWEEAVFQASSYYLKEILNKSKKHKEKLAPVTEQDILSHINMKKFLKQLRIILNSLLQDVDRDSEGNTKDKITRIEELVQVI